MFVHATQIQFQPNCQFNKGIGLLLSINAGLFLYLFSAFYVKTYMKNQRDKAAAAALKKDQLDALPKAKPEELNHKEESRNGISAYLEDMNNNECSKHKDSSSMSPLTAKLLEQNGHLAKKLH